MIEAWVWGNSTVTHNATVKQHWRSVGRSQLFEPYVGCGMVYWKIWRDGLICNIVASCNS